MGRSPAISSQSTLYREMALQECFGGEKIVDLVYCGEVSFKTSRERKLGSIGNGSPVNLS